MARTEAEATRSLTGNAGRTGAGSCAGFEYETNATRLAELSGGLEGGQIGALRRRLQSEQGVGRTGQFGVMAFANPPRKPATYEGSWKPWSGRTVRMEGAGHAAGCKPDGGRRCRHHRRRRHPCRGRELQQRQQAATDRNLQDTQRSTAAIHAQNQVRIDGLKKATEELAAQSKQYRELLAQQRAQLRYRRLGWDSPTPRRSAGCP